jgi:hypothetical protein
VKLAHGQYSLAITTSDLTYCACVVRSVVLRTGLSCLCLYLTSGNVENYCKMMKTCIFLDSVVDTVLSLDACVSWRSSFYEYKKLVGHSGRPSLTIKLSPLIADISAIINRLIYTYSLCNASVMRSM